MFDIFYRFTVQHKIEFAEVNDSFRGFIYFNYIKFALKIKWIAYYFYFVCPLIFTSSV